MSDVPKHGHALQQGDMRDLLCAHVLLRWHQIHASAIYMHAGTPSRICHAAHGQLRPPNARVRCRPLQGRSAQALRPVAVVWAVEDEPNLRKGLGRILKIVVHNRSVGEIYI